MVDEYGLTSGLVTVEDIYEEIVGKIEDEYDKKELPPITKISDTEYRINAMTSLSELNEEISLELPEDEFSNLAEFVMSLAEGFPKVGDVFVYKDNIKFTVKKIVKKRIIEILLEKPQTEEEENEE